MPGLTVPVPKAADDVDRPVRDKNSTATIYEPNGTCRFCGVNPLVAELAGDGPGNNSENIRDGHIIGCRAVLRGWDKDDRAVEAYMTRCEKADADAVGKDIEAYEKAAELANKLVKDAKDAAARGPRVRKR